MRDVDLPVRAEALQVTQEYKDRLWDVVDEIESTKGMRAPTRAELYREKRLRSRAAGVNTKLWGKNLGLLWVPPTAGKRIPAFGYTVEHDLHLFLKRTWALSRAYGDASYHRERIARALSLGA